jgi:hypothetical protein
LIIPIIYYIYYFILQLARMLKYPKWNWTDDTFPKQGKSCIYAMICDDS